MHTHLADPLDVFLVPIQIATRAEVLARPCPIPDAPGVYGWWFKSIPGRMDVKACAKANGLALLYTGISPKRPPANGSAASRQHLRGRIKAHYAGNAEGSTLRKTLGCLLASELGIELRRVGSGNRMTFVLGEQALSRWMQENAFVSWLGHEEPWELESRLIAAVDLPLNLDGNARNQFHPELTGTRKQAVEAARLLPSVPNPGIGGR